MTTVTINSDSEEKTTKLMRLANELGLPIKIQDVEGLTVGSMVSGIGRKATNEELTAYLQEEKNEEPIDLHIAFFKYTTK